MILERQRVDAPELWVKAELKAADNLRCARGSIALAAGNAKIAFISVDAFISEQFVRCFVDAGEVVKCLRCGGASKVNENYCILCLFVFYAIKALQMDNR